MEKLPIRRKFATKDSHWSSIYHAYNEHERKAKKNSSVKKKKGVELNLENLIPVRQEAKPLHNVWHNTVLVFLRYDWGCNNSFSAEILRPSPLSALAAFLTPLKHRANIFELRRRNPGITGEENIDGQQLPSYCSQLGGSTNTLSSWLQITSVKLHWKFLQSPLPPLQGSVTYRYLGHRYTSIPCSF